ncbi:MAG TPA: hypothetical protein ENI08_00045 [Candidatus Dependentiae bacterium]|nr:hypothetical protein [Candidatus Dependentiae bacterium]
MGKKKRKGKAFKNRPFYDKLIIPTDVYQKIRALTLEASGEISGFGRTSLVQTDGAFGGTALRLEELEIFTQECQCYHTTLKKDALHTLYYEVAKNDGNPEEWNFWWHSHVDMDTGFSLEDDNTMKDISKDGGLIVALCTNKDGDTTSTIYKNGRRLMNNLPVVIISPIPDDARAEARQIIKDKVTYVPEFNYRNLMDYDGDFLHPDDIDYEDVKKYTEGMSKRKKKRFLDGVREFFRDKVGI